MDFSIDLLHLTLKQAQTFIYIVAGFLASEQVGIFFNCCFNRWKIINFARILLISIEITWALFTMNKIDTLIDRVDYVATNLTNLLLNIKCLVRVAHLQLLLAIQKHEGFK